MYFVVSEQNEPLRELDFIALENIIITLQFSLIRHVLEENLEKRHLRDLEYRMLNGSLSNDEENEVAGMLGLNDAEIYRVVTFRMDAIKNMEKFTKCPDKRNRIGRKRNYTLFTEGAYFFANQPDCIYSQRNGTGNRIGIS